MGFLLAIEAEISKIEAELQQDPRYVKLRELRRLRDLYSAANDPMAADKTETAPGAERKRKSTSPLRAAAMQAAKEYIRGKTEPTKTADIFAHINSKGIEIGGNDPRNNLSAMLHNSPDFQSHGRSGWTLKHGQETQTVSVPADEAGNGNPGAGGAGDAENLFE